MYKIQVHHFVYSVNIYCITHTVKSIYNRFCSAPPPFSILLDKHDTCIYIF